MQREYRIAVNRIPVLDKPDKDFPWHDYVDCFEPHDLSGYELLYKIGKGHGFAPIFRGDGRPTLQNFVESQFIAVDMDTEDERSSYATLSQHPLVTYHGALIYPTHSSTPEKPRHRVVFLLDMPIYSAAAYKKAIDAVTVLFDGADRSGGANKTWMGNGQIDFRNLWEQCHLPTSFQFTPEQVTHYIVQHKLLQNRERAKQVDNNVLKYRRETGQDVPALAETGRRLFAIDPYSLSYDEWVKVGAALAHTYGDNAYWLFKDWSDRPGKDPVTMAKWQSLGREAAGKSAGYGSIVQLFKENHV